MKAEDYVQKLAEIARSNENYYGGYESILFRAIKMDLKNEESGIRWTLEEGGEIEGKFDTCYFHKSFRQIDVTESGYLDMIIWTALGESDIALKLLEIMRNDKEVQIIDGMLYQSIEDKENE